jgi:hypothetical protein
LLIMMNRQREVVIVDAALLGLQAMHRVGLFPRHHRVHHLALAGNDQHQHVRHHHRADHRADVDVGRAPAQVARQHVSAGHQEHEHHQAERQVVLAEPGAAQQVVHGPADHQAAQANRHRLPGRQVGYRPVDHHRLCIEIVDDDQQRKARQPGGIRLPLEPVEFPGQLGRRDQVFLRIVEAAPMHRPQFARHALLRQL